MPLTDNLISYWELEEASGTRNDSHGSNHLTDNNTVTQGTGKVGNCGSFEEGNGEYLSINDNPDLSVGNIDFTLCCWVNLQSKPAHKMSIVGKHDADDLEYEIRWSNASDRFEFRVASATGPTDVVALEASTLGSPSTATWYFIVAWHNAALDTVNIQINNGTIDSTPYTSGSYDSGGSFKIGSVPDFLEHFDGLIDQVGFWKRVLTAQERSDLYNSGNGLSYAALTGGGASNKVPILMMRQRLMGARK